MRIDGGVLGLPVATLMPTLAPDIWGNGRHENVVSWNWRAETLTAMRVDAIAKTTRVRYLSVGNAHWPGHELRKTIGQVYEIVVGYVFQCLRPARQP